MSSFSFFFFVVKSFRKELFMLNELNPSMLRKKMFFFESFFYLFAVSIKY